MDSLAFTRHDSGFLDSAFGYGVGFGLALAFLLTSLAVAIKSLVALFASQHPDD